MSNRDGKHAKLNARKAKHYGNKICPVCRAPIGPCDQGHKEGHRHHRWCKTCGYENY